MLEGGAYVHLVWLRLPFPFVTAAMLLFAGAKMCHFVMKSHVLQHVYVKTAPCIENPLIEPPLKTCMLAILL